MADEGPVLPNGGKSDIALKSKATNLSRHKTKAFVPAPMAPAEASTVLLHDAYQEWMTGDAIWKLAEPSRAQNHLQTSQNAGGAWCLQV